MQKEASDKSGCLLLSCAGKKSPGGGGRLPSKCGRCAEQCPNGALELIEWENVNHSSGPTKQENPDPLISEKQDYVGGGKIK